MTDKRQKELDSMLDAALDDLDSDSDSNDDDEYNDEINQRSVENNNSTTQKNNDITTDEEQDEVRMAKALENVMEGLMKMNTETEGNHQSQSQQQQEEGDKEDLEFSQEAFVNFIQEMKKAVSTMDEETTNQKTRAKPSNNNPDDSTTVNNDVDRTVSKILNDMAKSSNEENDNGHVDYNQVFPEAAQMEQMGEELMESMMKEFGKHFASATAAAEPSTSTEKNNKQKNNSASDNDIQENVLLEGMMKQLLNKEVMYDPMKQVSDRFPKWLAEHKSTLSEEEYNRYGQQYQYFQRIVHVYERDPENYPRLMELMQDIQE